MGTLELRLTCVDQLILAREQLEHVDAMNGRVAHVLTDNAVELMLHHQAEQTLQHKWSHPEVTDVSNKDESDYLGRHLKPKLKLAKLLGVLNNEEAEFVLINHEIRNEVYHTGVRHEAVILGYWMALPLVRVLTSAERQIRVRHFMGLRKECFT